MLSSGADRGLAEEERVLVGSWPRRILVGLGPVVLAVLLLGFRLGGTGLWTDESIYAQTAREMARSGDWITPTLCGSPYLIKPVLYHWLAATASHLAGENELAARIPQALAGCLLVIFLGGIAARALGRGEERSAGGPVPGGMPWLAGSVLLTAPGFAIGARVAGMDVLLTLFVTSAIVCFHRGYRDPATRRAWFLASGLSGGLGMLAKGPLGLFIPTLVILIFLAARGDLPSAFSRPALGGAVLAVVTASIWYLPVWIRHGGKFTRVFWVGNNLARISEPVSDHAGPPTYYLPIFLAAFLPWSLPFAVAFGKVLRRVWKQRTSACSPEDLLLIVWFAAPFLFYSAIATKLPGYLLPIFPAAALLLAREWQREQSAARRRGGGAFRIACALGVTALPGVALAVPFLLEYRYEIRPPWIWAFPVLAFAAALPAALSSLLRRGKLRAVLWVAAAAVFTLGLARFVVAPVEPFESMKGFAERLTRLGKAGYPVALAGPHLRGTLFYTGCSVPHPRDINDLPRPGPGLPLYCLVKDRFRPDLEDWARRGRFHLRTVSRTGALSLMEVSWE